MSTSNDLKEQTSFHQTRHSQLPSWDYCILDVPCNGEPETFGVSKNLDNSISSSVKDAGDHQMSQNVFDCDNINSRVSATVSDNTCSYSFQNVQLMPQDYNETPVFTHGLPHKIGSDESDKAILSKSVGNTSKSFFTYRDAPKQILSERSSRKSKSSSGVSWSFGQFLNKKQNDSNLKTKNPVNEVFAINEGASKRSTSTSPQNDNPNFSSTNTNIQPTQMKTKLRSAWNNMIYGLRMKREVNLKVDSAIWLLGQCYHNKLNDSVVLSQDVAKQLKLDLLSKIWLTYRINFPAIPGTDIISDTGWGCMLRCGQMMMAQALVCHFLHRDWRLSCDQSIGEKKVYRMILRWFGDSLSEMSPFSLHHLVSLGENYGRKAGDWYGPTHAAHVLRDALTEAKKENLQLKNLCMYVASDGIVFKQDVLDLCGDSLDSSTSTSFIPEDNSASDIDSRLGNVSLTEEKTLMKAEKGRMWPSSLLSEQSNSMRGSSEISNDYLNFQNPCPSYSEYGPPSYNTTQNWKSLILFVSVRLGHDKINPFYIPCLKSLLAYEHCIGIIGGRPKHALYFIGWQDDRLIHMDPHSCQPAIDVEKEDFNEKSFHSSSIRTMSFTEMDPSCAIGFYFRRREDFMLFVEKFSEITASIKRNLDYPVFALAEGKRIE